MLTLAEKGGKGYADIVCEQHLSTKDKNWPHKKTKIFSKKQLYLLLFGKKNTSARRSPTLLLLLSKVQGVPRLANKLALSLAAPN